MIELRALGPTRLTGHDDNELHSVLARPRLLGLLVVLASAPAAGFLRRDTLLGLFWPEADQERARASLRQAIYTLRQSLGTDALEASGDEEIRLNPKVVWSDIGAFKAAMSEGAIEAALELFNGDLLDGFFLGTGPAFETWLHGEREALRASAGQGAWNLAEKYASLENPAAAGHWVRRSLSLDPFDETRLKQGMGLLARVGDRAGALQAFESFARRLKAELDLSPTQEVISLAEEISRGTAERPTGPKADDAHAGVPASNLADAGDQAPAVPAVRLGSTPPWLWVAGTAVLVTAVIAGFMALGPGAAGRTGSSPPSTLPDHLSADSLSASSVAVLPFEAQGPSEGDRVLADGVHEEILTYLSRVPGLHVVSRRSVERYARTDLTLPEIAVRLGVGSVLEGSVQRDGDRVRITVQLIDAATDTHIWAQTFYREPRDLLEVQFEIAVRVATALMTRILPADVAGPAPDSVARRRMEEMVLEAMAGVRPAVPDSAGEPDSP